MKSRHSVAALMLFAALASSTQAANIPSLLYTFDSNGGTGTTVTDDSGNGHTGTFNGVAAFTTDARFGTYGARMGATGNGWLDILPIYVMPQQFTVAGFLKLDPAVSADRLQILFATTNGVTSGVYFGVDNRNCCGSAEIIFGTYTGSFQEASGGNGSFAIDNNYHMIAAAVDRNTNTVQLYYDGLPITTTGLIDGSYASNAPIGEHLNVWPGGNFFSNTTVDNFQIYEGLLAPYQVALLNQNGIVPEPSSALLLVIGGAGLLARRRARR